MRVIDRRHFLKRSSSVAAGGVLLRGIGMTGALGALGGRLARAAGGPRSLVMVRLYGGNDGLNTVIPFTQAAYHDIRPTLGVSEASALHLNATVGLHPRMVKLKQHFDAGRLAVVQSVGYPDPSLSHFRSEVIWQSADPVGITPTGWLGRWLDIVSPPDDEKVRAVDISYYLEPVLASDHANVFAINGLDGLGFPTDYGHYGDAAAKRAAFDAVSLLSRPPGSVPGRLARGGYILSKNVDLFAAVPDPTTVVFPDTNLAQSLKSVARMIVSSRAGDLSSGIYQVSIDGFDTHAKQDDDGGHPDRWSDIDASLDAFHKEMTARGAADDVLVVVYSEFGRRVEENDSKGTDHGTAAPMFAFGNPVIGGVYGPDADLANLDGDGNLVHAIDFREVYATVVERWLGGNSAAILSGSFTPVGFLAP